MVKFFFTIHKMSLNVHSYIQNRFYKYSDQYLCSEIDMAPQFQNEMNKLQIHMQSRDRKKCQDHKPQVHCEISQYT